MDPWEYIIDDRALSEISDQADNITEELIKSIYPKHKVKEKKCGVCVETPNIQESNACKECECHDCLGTSIEKIELERKMWEKDRIDFPVDGCRSDICTKRKWKEKTEQQEIISHPCHNKKRCFFAYYKPFTKKNKKPEIHFIQPNLLWAYYKLPEKYRKPNNFLWPVMVTCTFYHELGHHLIELYRRYSTPPPFSYAEEQRLCEILGFGFTLHLLSRSGGVNPPIKYLKTSVRGKRLTPDYDIGHSNIYHQLPLYTSKPFSNFFDCPPIYGLTSPSDSRMVSSKAITSLSAIAAAKGGRGKGGEYEPKMTNPIREFIEHDKRKWNDLFNYLFEPNSYLLYKSILPDIHSSKLSKKTLAKIKKYNINDAPPFPRTISLSKNNIKICTTKRCDTPLDKEKINNQNEISTDSSLIYQTSKSGQKGRILDRLQQLGYTHKEYREIRKDRAKHELQDKKSIARDKALREEIRKSSKKKKKVKLY